MEIKPGLDSKPTREKQYYDDDENYADYSIAAVTITVTVTTNAPAESTYQEDDEEDYEDETDRHFISPVSAPDYVHLAGGSVCRPGTEYFAADRHWLLTGSCSTHEGMAADILFDPGKIDQSCFKSPKMPLLGPGRLPGRDDQRPHCDAGHSRLYVAIAVPLEDSP
jgi:hypothetical protein